MSNIDITEWIRFAATDYDTAQNMARVFKPVPLEIVCFLCQQSVEKILKAYLLAIGKPLVKTHDLYILLKQCKAREPQFTKFINIGAALTTYAVFARYPSFDTITAADMQIALTDAGTILEFTKSCLKTLGYA